MQEVEFKLDVRRNRNSDPKPEAQTDHVDVYFPGISRYRRGRTFPMGCDRRGLNPFNFIS